MCTLACIGEDIPAKNPSISLCCSERRRYSAISLRMSDALDCTPWRGYHGMYAAINDIGVQMPDIAARQPGRRSQIACRGHCFSWDFRD
jgi:hypothetical protein